MPDSLNITQASKHSLDTYPETYWTVGSAILLFQPVIVIGNGFVLAAILLDPFKNIRSSPSSNLMFNLALADFLVGILTAPLTAAWFIYMAVKNTELFSINIISFTDLSVVGGSLYTLIALSVDRKIAITAPLQYKHRVTKKKVRNVNICIWISCISFALPTLLFENYETSDVILTNISAAHTTIASIALAVLNIAVIRSVRTQSLNIKRTVDSENRVVLQNAFNREKTVTRITLTMVVAFEICVFPYVVVWAANAYFFMTDLQVKGILLWVSHLVEVLVFANSLINPFLYVWRLPKYRKAFQYILNQIKKKACNCPAQPEANESRDFPPVQGLSFVANYKPLATLLKTAGPVCSSVKNIADVKEQIDNTNGECIENTKL